MLDGFISFMWVLSRVTLLISKISFEIKIGDINWTKNCGACTVFEGWIVVTMG